MLRRAGGEHVARADPAVVSGESGTCCFLGIHRTSGARWGQCYLHSIGKAGRLLENTFVYLESVRHKEARVCVRLREPVYSIKDGAAGVECPLDIRPLTEEQQRGLSFKLKLPWINCCVTVIDNEAVTQGSCTGTIWNACGHF